MGGFAGLILALTGPVMRRAMLFLGAMVLTVVGVDAAVAALILLLKNSWSGLPAAVLQLCSLAKLDTGLGIIIGAHLAKIQLWIKLRGAQVIFKHGSSGV